MNKNVTWITEAVPIHAENQEAVGKTVDGLTVPHAAKATNAANAAKAGNLKPWSVGFRRRMHALAIRDEDDRCRLKAEKRRR